MVQNNPFGQGGQPPPWGQPGQPWGQQPGQQAAQPGGQQPAQPAAQQTGQQPGDGSQEAFGFTGQQPPQDEVYNTRYLVANMKRAEMKPKIVILAVVGAALLGIILWLALGSGPGGTIPEGANGAPAVTAPKAPTPAPAKGGEH